MKQKKMELCWMYHYKEYLWKQLLFKIACVSVRRLLMPIYPIIFRKRFSCPSTAAEMPFLCFDNLRPTSLDLTGARRFSDTIQEMPDMPVGDEFVVLDRETQEELSNDIETCRALLLNLGVLICQVS